MLFPCPTLSALLQPVLGNSRTSELFSTLSIDPALVPDLDGEVSRAQLAQALNMLLFAELLGRVPSGAAYVRDTLVSGIKAQLDHGALRTVAWPHNGSLPSGIESIARILRPLGYAIAADYPLPKLKMSGYAFAHRDFPQSVSQFFVSELHPERFSPAFQSAVTRVVSTSRDPLTQSDLALLDELAERQRLPLQKAQALLPSLARCFDRQHAEPTLADYELLKAESAEMAWIATEGNVFNHATDRVADVFETAAAQRAAGRRMKDAVEVSANGRVKQTALLADPVIRGFIGADGRRVEKFVPGSFYEFITRAPLPDGSGLDLSFDSGNATGIFNVTSTASL